MAIGLSDLIPGLREAEDRYRRENAEAFAGVEPRICGMVDILPMTPKMFIDLEGAENALFSRAGKEITPGDICTFLWRCSPHYRFGDDEAVTLRRLFNASLFVLPAQPAIDGIVEYIRRSWSGMPQWKSKGSPDQGVAQWPSRLVHMFAKEYGWLEEYTLNLPFRRLWQYANRVLESNDPDYREICSAAMKARADYLIKLQAQLDADAKAEEKGRN
jgi:hypothetical protein